MAPLFTRPRLRFFRAFELTPIEQVKAVVIGTRPLSPTRSSPRSCIFCERGVRIPPSLRNIYKAIQVDYPEG